MPPQTGQFLLEHDFEIGLLLGIQLERFLRPGLRAGACFFVSGQTINRLDHSNLALRAVPQLLKRRQADHPEQAQTLYVLHHDIVILVQVGRKRLADDILMLAKYAAECCILHFVLEIEMKVSCVVSVAAAFATIPKFTTAGLALKQNHSAM